MGPVYKRRCGNRFGVDFEENNCMRCDRSDGAQVAEHGELSN